ncbi:MAG: aminotransferase [Pseudomonadota bacterium]
MRPDVPLTNVARRDIETLLHPYTNLAVHRETGPLTLERAEGVYVYDGTGKPYLEGMAGLWCTSLGYGNEELVEAAADQMRRLSFSHLFGGKSHDPGIALAEKLKEISPVPVSKVFFSSSGSEANDTQVKLIWYYNNARGMPDKKVIIARERGYHGVTVATASLTGLPANHIDFDLPIDNITHTLCPSFYRFGQDGETEEEFATRLAQGLEDKILEIGPDRVAAFFAEPVMGAGGVIVPPETYYAKIQAVLDKYDVLLVADEVICGFGRLGEMFGSTVMGMTPGSISVAKALSSAYQPIGAVMIPEEIYEACVDESRKIGTFGHGFTYSGHPVAAATALKTLEIYERDNIVGQVREKMPQFQARLAALSDHPLVGEARGKGLIGAIEIVADKGSKTQFDPKSAIAAKVAGFCEEAGLILRPLYGDVVAICPPLVITTEQIDELFDKLAGALDRAEEMVTAQDLRAA